MKKYPIKKDIRSEVWSFLNGEAKTTLSKLSTSKDPHTSVYATAVKGLRNFLSWYEKQYVEEDGYKGLLPLEYLWTEALVTSVGILKNYSEYDFSNQTNWLSLQRDNEILGVISGLELDSSETQELFIKRLPGGKSWNLHNPKDYDDSILTGVSKLVSFIGTVERPDGTTYTQKYKFNTAEYSLQSYIEFVQKEYLGKGYYLYFGYYL